MSVFQHPVKEYLMQVGYYPGCSLESTAKEFDLSIRAVFEALDVSLKEIPDWSCCGASAAHYLNEEERSFFCSL